MTDFGTKEERLAALRVCEACKALNEAIEHAASLNINIKIVDVVRNWDDRSDLQIHRMERRTPILPSKEG